MRDIPTSEWRKDDKISHYKSPSKICFRSCYFYRVKNHVSIKILVIFHWFKLHFFHRYVYLKCDALLSLDRLNSPKHVYQRWYTTVHVLVYDICFSFSCARLNSRTVKHIILSLHAIYIDKMACSSFSFFNINTYHISIFFSLFISIQI